MHTLTLTRPSTIVNDALAKRSKAIPVTAIGALTLVWTLPVFAAGDVTSMQVMANSYEMQGTTDFYYNNEWLVKFVQFAISWLCIIALLVYYAGWLCSLVVLSNKELFYLIDTIKKEASEGADSGDKKGWSAFTSVMHTFKNGSKDGVNGGLDNLVLFVLSLSINFKAYSYYKDVEAGSDGDGANGNGFSYNDTILNFLLKTAINAIAVTFVTSIAISGVLLQCWFTISDVFAVRAERFAQTNLSAKIDGILGTAGGYSFTIGNSGTHGYVMTEDIAKRAYGATLGQFPNASADQMHALGVATENAVLALILGDGGQSYYSTLENKVRQSVPQAERSLVKITNETQAKLVSFSFDVNTNPRASSPGTLTLPMENILTAANVSADETNQTYMPNLYIHVLLKWDARKAAGFANTNQ